MATTSPRHQREGASLRPRIVDASQIDYHTAAAYIQPDDDAYFERKPGQTNLIIR